MEGRPMVHDEDMMDVDQKAGASTNRGDPSIESLQQDIGTAFHLCKTCKVLPLNKREKKKMSIFCFFFTALMFWNLRVNTSFQIYSTYDIWA